MKIQNYNLITNINKQNFGRNSTPKEISYAEKKSNETKRQLTTALIATAITSAFIGGMLAKKKPLNIDTKSINDLRNQIADLTQDKKHIEKSSTQLKRILDETLIPKETHNQLKKFLLEDLKTINDYDMTKPYKKASLIDNPFATSIKDATIEIEDAHKVIQPTSKEEQKIGIIRLAMEELSDAIRKDGKFNRHETIPKIYIFNKLKEEDKGSNLLAEAILNEDAKTFEGFWIEKNYLNRTSFSDALETALHEMCHKYGGDESSEFSYKLTDVNSRVLGKITEDSQTALTMKILNEMWNEIA